MPRYSFAQREPREDPAAVIGLALRLADAEAQDFYARKNYEIGLQREERDARMDELRIAQEQMDLDRDNGKLSEATGAYAHFSGINPADPAFGARMAEGIAMFPNGRMDGDVSKLIESKIRQRDQVRTDFKRLFGEDVDPDAHITDGRYDPNKMQAWAFGKKQRALAEQQSLADVARGVGAEGLQFNAAGEPLASFQFKDPASYATKAAELGMKPEEISPYLDKGDFGGLGMEMGRRSFEANTKKRNLESAAKLAAPWKAKLESVKFDKLDIPGTAGHAAKVAQQKEYQAEIDKIYSELAPEAGTSAAPTSQPTGKVRVYNPAGKAGWIPAENLDAALKAGFKRAE